MSDGADCAPHAPKPTAKKDPIPEMRPRFVMSKTCPSDFGTGAAKAIAATKAKIVISKFEKFILLIQLKNVCV